MNIVIGSAFRNAEHYVPRYMGQVAALQMHAGPSHSIRVVAVEGDSKDGTRDALSTLAAVRRVSLKLVSLQQGTPWFGSTEAPERMAALSEIGNTIFDAVDEDDDVLVYVESDLVWDAYTVGSLIDMATRCDGGFDIFAPLVFAGPYFYDIWGFRKNGERFVPFDPYHIGLEEDKLTELDSAGSCLVMRGEVARVCRIRDGNCLVGWCGEARARGYRIATHKSFRITHP